MKNFKEKQELYVKYMEALSVGKKLHHTIAMSSDYYMGNQKDKEIILESWQQEMVSNQWDDWVIHD
jgi:hypothetical protein